jgi:small-conductance mechanosensitive channel
MEQLDQLILSLIFWINSDIKASIPYLIEIWNALNDYAILRFLALVIVNYFIARFISNQLPPLVTKATRYLRFSLGEKIAELLGPLLFKVVFLIAMIMLVSANELSESQSFAVIATMQSLIIIFVLLFVNALVYLILEHLSTPNDAGDPVTVLKAIVPIYEYTALIFIILIGVYLVFGVWNIEMTALLASAGVMGLAISMASKDTLSDVIAGILILSDAPFELGDVIEVSDEIGTITQIGIRSTRIKTRANVELVIPNSKIGSSVVINKSFIVKNKLKIKLPIIVAFGTDPEIVRKILLDVAKEHERVLNEKMQVALIDFNQEQVTFTLICFIDEGVLAPKIVPAMRESIYLKFIEENIPLPSSMQEITVCEFPNIFGGGAPRQIPKFNTSHTLRESE